MPLNINIPAFDPELRQTLAYECFHSLRREYPEIEEEIGEAAAVSYCKRVSEVVSFFLVALNGVRNMKGAWGIVENIYPEWLTDIAHDDFLEFVTAMVAADNHPVFAEFYTSSTPPQKPPLTFH